MLQTIEIYQESSKRKPASYLAVCGQEQAKGKTPGQALDSLDEMLSEEGEPANSLIILQRFQPDALFTRQHQERLPHQRWFGDGNCERDGFRAIKHQSVVGAGYFDETLRVLVC